MAPELFKAFNSAFLARIFNTVFSTGIFPKAWSVGCIKPIYKKGDENLPSNYRGITLLPIMGKLLTSILNDRILEWAETHNKINDAQFGFRKGRNTIDTLFIIHTISLIALKRKTPMFLAFVDLAKAFDSINHDLMWFKLSTIGLSTKMLEMLQPMYGNARSVVSYDGYTECQKGVRQGCPLSPLLFFLFVSDLEGTLKSNGSGKIRIGEEEVTIMKGTKVQTLGAVAGARVHGYGCLPVD